MAVTLTALELAAALRLSDGTTPLEEPQAGTLNRLLGAATAIVEEAGPGAAEVVQNEAAVRVASYLYDNEGATNRRFSDVLAFSGAMSILAPFRVQRATALDDSGAAAVPIPPTGGLNAQQVTTLIQQLVPGLLTTAIAGHAALPNIHHAPTDVPSLARFLVGLPVQSGQTVTFALQDGTTGTITLPMEGEAVADGVINGLSVDDDSQVVTITTTTGGSFTVDLTAAIEAVGAGLTQADVDARIKAFARTGGPRHHVHGT